MAPTTGGSVYRVSPQGRAREDGEVRIHGSGKRALGTTSAVHREDASQVQSILLSKDKGPIGELDTQSSNQNARVSVK